jgi:hypothetical protein
MSFRVAVSGSFSQGQNLPARRELIDGNIDLASMALNSKLALGSKNLNKLNTNILGVFRNSAKI